MLPVRAYMLEMIQQLHHLALRIFLLLCSIVHFALEYMFCIDPMDVVALFPYFVQDLNLVKGRFLVVLCAFLHLDGHWILRHQIAAQPYCGEVTPSHFLHYDLSVVLDLPYKNRVLPTRPLVHRSFFLRLVVFVFILVCC